MTKRQPRISSLTEVEMIDAEELWIERLRQEISRDDIAKAVGRCKDTIKDWEYGRFVPRHPVDYLRWCQALGVNPIKNAGLKQWWDDESL